MSGADLDLLADDFIEATGPHRDPEAALLGVELAAAPLVVWFRESGAGLRLHRREPCEQRHADLLMAAGALAIQWANSLPQTVRDTLGRRGGCHFLVCARGDELALAATDGVRLVELARREIRQTTH